MSEPPFATGIEARPDSFGARRALGGVGGHFGAPHINWSGRPDSNRRRPAWEAGILPLNYGRPALPILLLRATMTALLAVLDSHLRGFDALVAARLPADPLARAVEVELLVERRGRGVLDPQLVDLVIEGEPLLLDHLLLRGVHEAVEVRVRSRSAAASASSPCAWPCRRARP